MLVRQDNQTFNSFLGTNEIFVVKSILTTEEQSILIRWANQKLQDNRLLVNPRDPKNYLTPFWSSTGGLTRFTKDSLEEVQKSESSLVWIPKVSNQFMDPLPDEFWIIRTRIIKLLCLQDLEEDHYKGSFLTYLAPGGKIYEHLDARLTIRGQKFMILRCNVLFKKPEQGGMPIIASQEIEICDRGMWAFFPTELPHSATEVCGSEFRGTLSFGFLVRSIGF